MAISDRATLVGEGTIKKPRPSSPAAHVRMKANRGRDTQFEPALRRELHRRGLRYRLHAQVIPDMRRQVDIAFMGIRLAVFIDGCFWHGCPTHRSQPRANSE